MPASALATPRPQSSWVWMPSFAFFTFAPSGAGDLGDFRGERAAVRVAEDEISGAGFVRGLVTGGGVGGVELVAVEGVLAVEDDLAALRDEVGDGVADHGEIFLRRGAQDLGDVEHGRLADERDDGRAGLEQEGDLRVFLHGGVRAAGAAEGGKPRVLELELLRLAEELDVLLVGAGPAALDVVHAEGVEALGDAELVGEGEVDAFTLRAVAERGVVEGDLRCGGHKGCGKEGRGAHAVKRGV